MPQEHTIRLHADGHLIEGLELLDVYEGERDKFHNLQSDGGIEFRTPRGKKFFVTFPEFSFFVPALS